jgi:arylsulfatase A-like enzyme
MMIWGVFLDSAPAAEPKPNVVVILTDDQGFGELGVTGNPVIRTPNIDRFAKQSASLTDFNVMPVCSPTRAGLLTGRHYYRTGVTDTWLGRSLIDPDETTLAEMLVSAGYRTGIFGKWHLGDNYPRRAMDQGFQESLVLNGGGLAQPGDPPDPADERGAYFNATLRHNGNWVKTAGYVSDVITDAAVDFIEKNHEQPFFVYLPFNCPHSPHQVPDSYRRHYPAEVFNPTNFPSSGNLMDASQKPADLARVYGMVENIDDNVGRLLAKLDELKLADNTIVVFFSDNGCQHHNGFNAGLRGWKGTPYQGGIHQFCFVRWPAELKAGQRVVPLTSHIDLAPTLLELCGVAKPERVKFDGRSLAPLMRGDNVEWADRTLVFQWHRGNTPERYRSCAIRSQDWKLVQPQGSGENWAGQAEFQLFNLAQDPYEQHDVAAEHPQRVHQLKEAYDAWFDDVMRRRDFAVPQRIFIGTKHENPVLLTRQDWRGPLASWKPGAIGCWDLQVTTGARYAIKLRFDPAKAAGTARLNYDGVSTEQPIKTGDEQCTFANVPLPAGSGRLEPTLEFGSTVLGVNYVEVCRLE